MVFTRAPVVQARDSTCDIQYICPGHFRATCICLGIFKIYTVLEDHYLLKETSQCYYSLL